MTEYVCSDRECMLPEKDTNYVHKPFRDLLHHKKKKKTKTNSRPKMTPSY